MAPLGDTGSLLPGLGAGSPFCLPWGEPQLCFCPLREKWLTPHSAFTCWLQVLGHSSAHLGHAHATWSALGPEGLLALPWGSMCFTPEHLPWLILVITRCGRALTLLAGQGTEGPGGLPVATCLESTRVGSSPGV